MTVQISNRDYFMAWLWYFVCATVGGALAGALVGAATGASLRASGIDLSAIIYVIWAFSLIASAALSFVFFRFFVGRLFERVTQRAGEAPNVA